MAFIEDLSWVEVKRGIDAGLPVLIPIGATAKAHGPHLPLQTDYLTARALAARSAAAYRLLVAPGIGLGHYPAFTPFAGSQSVAADLFEAMLTQSMALLIAQGARKLALLNTGVSTERPVDAAAAAVREAHGTSPAVAHMRLLGGSAVAALDNPDGGHADERETSLMLAIAPERVRLDLAIAAMPDAETQFARTAATGDARKATAAKGEALLAAMVDDMVALLRRSFG